jgi:hypothetical protein
VQPLAESETLRHAVVGAEEARLYVAAEWDDPATWRDITRPVGMDPYAWLSLIDGDLVTICGRDEAAVRSAAEALQGIDGGVAR